MTIYRRIGNTEDFQAWLDSLPRDGTFHEMRTNEMVKLGVSLGFIDTQNKVGSGSCPAENKCSQMTHT